MYIAFAINERKTNSIPCGILSCNLWICGPENSHCANKATDVAVGETAGNDSNLSRVCLKQPYNINSILNIHFLKDYIDQNFIFLVNRL